MYLPPTPPPPLLPNPGILVPVRTSVYLTVYSYQLWLIKEEESNFTAHIYTEIYWLQSIPSNKADTSLKWTRGVGPCSTSVIYFISLQDRHLSKVDSRSWSRVCPPERELTVSSKFVWVHWPAQAAIFITWIVCTAELRGQKRSEMFLLLTISLHFRKCGGGEGGARVVLNVLTFQDFVSRELSNRYEVRICW